MNTTLPAKWWSGLVLGLSLSFASAGLESGDRVQLTLRGVPGSERNEVDGEYRVGESGTISLPLLQRKVRAAGLTVEQLARAAETAYRDEGIYTRPAIEVVVVKGKEVENDVVISVGGQVRRAGQFPYRKDMTVIQAIDAAGGRNEFGSRNVLLVRDGKQYCLDFSKLQHKSIRLRPDDSLQIEQKGVVDRWRGEEAAVKPLLGTDG